MPRNDSKEIFDDLPESIKEPVAILAVSPVLTQTVAEELLRHSGYANGNAPEKINEIKSFPVWIQRNKMVWAIDDELRKQALDHLNGRGKRLKKEAVRIFQKFQSRISEFSHTESNDLKLQIARLQLSIPEERKNAISSLRLIFDAAELFNNHESSRVISAYIDESLRIDSLRGNFDESTLSAFFIRGLYAYRKKDERTALRYLTPVWMRPGNTFASVKDAAIAAHIIGLIYSKDQNRFRQAEEAFLGSIKLEKSNDNKHGLAQVYHSLGNLYGKDRNRFKQTEKIYLESIEILEQFGDKYGLGQVYHSLGLLYSKDRYRFKEAEEAYLKSIEFRFPVNDNKGLAKVYHSLGNLYGKDPRRYFSQAEEAYLKSIELEKSNKNKHGLAQVYHGLGNLYSNRRRYFRQAEEAYLKSIELGEEIRHIGHLAQVYMNFGRLKIARKDFHEARKYLNKSLKFERKEFYINKIQNYLDSIEKFK